MRKSSILCMIHLAVYIYLVFAAQMLWAAVIDNTDYLIIPAGETYTLSDTHSYTHTIQVEGTLIVKKYDGAASSGWLHLSAPLIIISSSGRISADGGGYGPNNGPGKGEYATGWSESRGGAGYGGCGGVSQINGLGGTVYGSIIAPVDFGSGGGTCYSAAKGSGGGALRISVGDVLENNGKISSNGSEGNSTGYDGGGSGGSVYITAATITGTGEITANGGQGYNGAGGGGGGRIAVYYTSISTGIVITSQGNSGNQFGGAGTIYKKTSSGDESLIIDNNNQDGAANTRLTENNYYLSHITIMGKSSVYVSTSSVIMTNELNIFNRSSLVNEGSLTANGFVVIDSSGLIRQNGKSFNAVMIKVLNGGTLYADEKVNVGDIEVSGGGWITHTSGGIKKLNLEVSNRVTIAAGGRISADGGGYGPNNGPGKGEYATGWSESRGGAGYGGCGGVSQINGLGGTVYGSITEPVDFGSGGGTCYSAAKGSGGGALRISVGDVLENNGKISSNGSEGNSTGYDGGGSGGSVYITAATITGAGEITANGGQGHNGAGGGGGGRIAVYYSTIISTAIAVKAIGGNGNQNGGAGTIYKKADSQRYGEVIIDGNNVSGKETFISGQFDRVQVKNKGIAISSSSIITDYLDMSGNGIFTNSGYAKLTNISLLNGASIYHQAGQFNTENDFQIGSGGGLFIDSLLTANSMEILAGGVVTHSSQDSDFNLTIMGNLTIASGGKITADKKGYSPGGGTGKGTDGNGTASSPAGGGGYGGRGGDGSVGAGGGTTYGSILEPSDMGSGGGRSESFSGYGGGIVRINVNNVLENNGTISSNGGDGRIGTGYDGGGSGGSVYLVAKTITGSGEITANGGIGGINAGGGGGGRIAVNYHNSLYNGIIEAKGGGNGEMGTVINISLSGDSPVSISKLSETFTRDKIIYETIERQNIVLNNRIFRNDTGIVGNIVFSNTDKIVVKTGSFANNGYFKSELNLNIGANIYNCHWKGMSYLNAGDRKMFLRGYLEGPVVGAIDMILQESIPGSNNYDIYIATISVTQVGNQLNTDKILLEGNAAYQNTVEYTNTRLLFLQTNIIGTCSGYNSGNLSVTMNHLQIDATDNPYYKEGFAIMSYNTESGSGMIYTYAHSDTKTALCGLITDPISGYVLGSFDRSKTPRELLLSVSRFNYGEQVQDYLDIKVDTLNSVSPGQVLTYNVELKNTGSQNVENIKVVVDLPLEVRFVDATGNYFYHNISNEGEWVDYPDPDAAPESVVWQIPSVPANSTMRFSIRAKANWGIAADTILEAVAGIYEYDPNYYNK